MKYIVQTGEIDGKDAFIIKFNGDTNNLILKQHLKVLTSEISENVILHNTSDVLEYIRMKIKVSFNDEFPILETDELVDNLIVTLYMDRL